MKFVIVLGSRNPAGQTARAAQAMQGGLVAAGAEGELFYLPTLQIERCRQCDANGWGTCRSDGACVISDDFASVVERIRAADVVVFATPVYYGDQSESMRAFTDRLRRICRAEFRQGIAGKPTVCICVAGGGGGGAPSCTVSLEKVLRTCGFDVVDLVPVRRQNLDFKLEVLERTGRWLATGPTS